jgi:hypothetical protein
VTKRDRLAGLVIGSVALLAVFWFLILGPKRAEVKSLKDKITQAQGRLQTANQTAATAAAARKRYDADYATVARLGKAVPADDDVASLLYQLDNAAHGAKVDFRSIKLDNGSAPAAPAAAPAAQAAAAGQAANGAPTTPASGSTPPATPTTPAPATGAAPATQSVAATLPPGAAVGSAGFPTLPFAFVFDGSYFDMERFFENLQGFTTLHGKSLSVSGRLLTVDSFALTASRQGFPRVKADIGATAYLVPQDEGVTGGATPTGPATATASTGSPAAPGAPAAATSITGGSK